MLPDKQQDAHTAGLKNGADMAAIVSKKFPDGFSISAEIGIEIRQAANDA